jgi:hypothetical protein
VVQKGSQFTSEQPAVSASEKIKSAPVNETEMLTDEKAKIAELRRSGDKTSPWVGLALSGGGIRSATFCLGALQRLAKANVLKHFDYISSVSGGGYTAASVQWWWVRDKNTDTGLQFPYGVKAASATEEDSQKLAFLRWHANYLAPGGGISIWSGFAVVIRTVIISLFVWLPIAVALMMGIEAIPAFIAGVRQRPDYWYQAGWDYLGPKSEVLVSFSVVDVHVPLFAVVALVAIVLVVGSFLLASVLLMLTSIIVPPETKDNADARVRWAARRAIYVLALGGALGAYFIYNLQNWIPEGGISQIWQLDPKSVTVFLISIGLLTFSFLAGALALLQRMSESQFGINYSFRRLFEEWSTYGFASLLALAILASLPFAALLLAEYQAAKGVVLGVVTALSGLVSGLYGHFVQAQRLAPTYARRWFATLAAGIFLYGVIFISYILAHFLIYPDSLVAPSTGQSLQEVFWAVFVFSVLFGGFSNLNYLGLHRYYRDRLMEAFLPSQITASAEPPTPSEAELAALSDFWEEGKHPIGNRPYPLFNTNVILINDKNSKRALRGGDSFVLSPLFLGSSATKWVRTKEQGERHGPLTLASAMAASGASANANAAYIGSGITRDRLISIVMMLLNVRLGIWLAAPVGTRFKLPNYFIPGLAYGILRTGYRSDSAFFELTDGGHFDNLGIYELVRRRVDIIVALDSEEDPSTSMSALASVCQRVMEDFNVVIDIGDKADKLAPAGNMGYPPEAKFTDRSFFITNVEYPACPASELTKAEDIDASTTSKPTQETATVSEQPATAAKVVSDDKAKIGKLVYVKSNMLKGLRFPVKGYKAQNPDFPNQPTVNQFFEPAQFEAYRELGFLSVEAFVTAFELDDKDKATLVAALQKAA